MFILESQEGVIKLKVTDQVAESFYKWLVLAALSYWLLFSLVSPVTLWDSNVYNIARLELHLRGGLFHNPYYNDPREAYMTWTFDALHLPFRILGFAESLPSFACFTGTLFITYAYSAKVYNRTIAWASCAALLSMPCLMYQASSTKPDIAVAFCCAVWFYVLFLYQENKQSKYIYLVSLSLAFAAGAKATGLLIAPILGLVALYVIRKDKGAIARLIVSSVLCFILWGSIEIYINNIRTFGHIFAPTGNDARNYDGLKGAIATSIRHLFSNTTLGVESFINSNSDLIGMWQSLCRSVLSLMSLSNKGMQLSPYITLDDNSMKFLKTGSETCSDFGPIGSVSLWASLVLLIVGVNKRTRLWYFSLFGIGYIFLFSYFIGWGLWGNRYLVVSLIPLSLVLVVIVETSNYNWVKVLFRITILASIILVPLASYNKGPRDLLAAIQDRQDFQLKENQILIPIVKGIDELALKDINCTIALCAGEDAWILPFFEIKGINLIPTPIASLSLDALKTTKVKYILFLQLEPPSLFQNKGTLLAKYQGGGGFWGRSSYIYQIAP